MQLTAAVRGFEQTPRGSVVIVVAAPEIVVLRMTTEHGLWRSRQWRDAQGRRSRNWELWEHLTMLVSRRAVQWIEPDRDDPDADDLAHSHTVHALAQAEAREAQIDVVTDELLAKVVTGAHTARGKHAPADWCGIVELTRSGIAGPVYRSMPGVETHPEVNDGRLTYIFNVHRLPDHLQSDPVLRARIRENVATVLSANVESCR